MINYVIGFGVAALVVFLVVHGIKRKSRGKSGGCGCGCSSCSSFSSCSSCSSAPTATNDSKE